MPPEGRGEVYVTLPGQGVGNGIVFDSRGRMYVADYAGHNVLEVEHTRIVAFRADRRGLAWRRLRGK